MSKWRCFKHQKGPVEDWWIWAWDIEKGQGYWVDGESQLPEECEKSGLSLDDFLRASDAVECRPAWIMLDQDLEIDEGL